MSRLLLVLVLFGSFAVAQPAANDIDVSEVEVSEAALSGSAEVADSAVATWLEQDTREAREQILAVGSDVDEVCRRLESFVLSPPPPTGTSVTFEDRQVLEATDTSALYSYPASFDNNGLAIVEARLSKENGVWQAEQVGINLSASAESLNSMSSTVQSPFSYVFFSLFSVALLVLLFRPGSLIRRWLTEGVGYLREHRGATIFSLLFFYGSFVAGYAAGTTLSDVCSAAMQNYIVQSLDSLGIVDAVTSQNTARLATAIFFQNFTFGAFATTFIPASLLAIPAYLFNGPRLFFLAMFIGDRGLGGPFGATLSIILYIVELLAYALVAAGGSMMLITLIREGFSGLSRGYRKLIMMLPLAMLILVIGAWYEAAIIHLFS